MDVFLLSECHSTTVIHWRVAYGHYDDGVRDAMFNVFEEARKRNDAVKLFFFWWSFDA
jgi:hypothetical protein